MLWMWMCLQACAARPCASTWLGAGIASLRLGDLKAADLAFTEANILDPHNPLVWGFLTLICLQSERVTEAETALQFAYKVRTVSLNF
jgi:Flp pilus assembly protein TadD